MDGAAENTSSKLNYHVVILGKTGSGKSATGNTILGRKAFLAKMSFKTVTQQVKRETITKNGVNLTIYDTPGFFDRENELNPEEMFMKYQGLPQLDTPDPLVCLLVLRPDRFTQEEKSTIEMMEDYLPDWLIKNTWIIFTRGDELEKEGCVIEDLIADSVDLKQVVQKFDNRYFTFNNVSQDPQHHVVKNMIEAIENVQPQRPSNPATFLQRKPPAELETNTKERRLILLGKTGSGKSATGNTILRKNVFKSEHSFSSVTKQCDIKRASVSGREVSIVDTPGFSELALKSEDIGKEIANSVALCSPGPHAFLYVVSLTGRLKPEDENDIKNIEKVYGEEVAKYTIPVFTHSDQVEGKDVGDLIRGNKTLSSFVEQCGGRYCIINNKDKINRAQANDLLQEIDSVIEKNGGGHYSNEMFQYAQSTQHDDGEKSTEPEQETEESWCKRMWNKAEDVFRKFRDHFKKAVTFLHNELNSCLVKLACMKGDGSDKCFEMKNDQNPK